MTTWRQLITSSVSHLGRAVKSRLTGAMPVRPLYIIQIQHEKKNYQGQCYNSTSHRTDDAGHRHPVGLAHGMSGKHHLHRCSRTTPGINQQGQESCQDGHPGKHTNTEHILTNLRCANGMTGNQYEQDNN